MRHQERGRGRKIGIGAPLTFCLCLVAFSRMDLGVLLRLWAFVFDDRDSNELPQDDDRPLL